MTDGFRPSQSRLGAAANELVMWAAAAMVAALGPLLWAWIVRPGFSVFRWGWDSRDAVWVVPVGYLIVFAPVGLLLALIALVRGSVPFRLSAGLWLTLVFFSIFLLFPQIHGYAWLVIAVGAALQLSRVLARRRSSSLAWSRRLALGLGALAVVGGVAVVGGRTISERRRVSALPAAPSGAPNVLLIIMDTSRWESLGLSGFTQATTPNLERWASRGTVFEYAYSTAPWTLPAHASMFTGKYAGVQSGTQTTPLDDRFVTIAEVFQSRGWATGGFTANFIATRFESGLSQGFIHFEDFKHSLAELARSTTITQADNLLRVADNLGSAGPRRALEIFFNSDFTPHFSEIAHDPKSAADVSSAFLRWQAAVGPGRPFFAFLNFFDAHSPYRPPRPYYSMFRKNPRTIDRYHGGIRYIDDELGKMFAELEKRRVLESTIVILAADHGEQFGEHDLRGHANSLYAQLVHVPLLVMFPGKVPQGARIARQVSLRDIPATIFDLAGVPRDSAIGGASLTTMWSGTPGPTSEVIAELDQTTRPDDRFKNSYGPVKALIDDSLYVIRDGRGGIEAFEYRSDPTQLHDLATDPARARAAAASLDAAVKRNSLFYPKPFPHVSKPNKKDPDDVS